MPNLHSVDPQQGVQVKSANTFGLDIKNITDKKPWNAYADWLVKKHESFLHVFGGDNNLVKTLAVSTVILTEVREFKLPSYMMILLKVGSLFDIIAKEKNIGIQTPFVPDGLSCLTELEYQCIKAAENFRVMPVVSLYQLIFSPNFYIKYYENIIMAVREYLGNKESGIFRWGTANSSLGVRRAKKLEEKVIDVASSSDERYLKIRRLVLLSACIECPPDSVSNPSFELKVLLGVRHRSISTFTPYLMQVLCIRKREIIDEYNELVYVEKKLPRATFTANENDCDSDDEMRSFSKQSTSSASEAVLQSGAIAHQSLSDFFQGTTFFKLEKETQLSGAQAHDSRQLSAP